MLFEITEADVALGEELAVKCGDIPEPQWARISAQLRAGGYAIKPIEPGDLGVAYGKVEPKVRALLARLAPPGTEVTPALIAKVKAAVVRIILVELRASGLNETTAKAMAALMSAAMMIKPKEEATG